MLVISSGFIIYFYNKNNPDKPFYESSNAKFNHTSYQQKDLNNRDITSGRQNIITETVKNVSPAVVGVNVIEIRQYRDPFSSFFDDPFLQAIFGRQGKFKSES